MVRTIRIMMAVFTLMAVVNVGAAEAGDSTAVAPRLIVRNCFTTAPADVLPLLEPQTRQDMLSYYDAGRDTPSENTFGADCRILSLDDDCLKMVSGSDMITQMFVLNPTGKNQVIGVIETVATPVPDSRVTFYDTKWRNLGPAVAIDPRLSDWLPKNEHRNIADIQREVPFVLAAMHFDPATLTVVAENNMHAYYPKGDTPGSLALLKPQLTYKWTGKKFRLEK